jgi:hypothetical protein
MKQFWIVAAVAVLLTALLPDGAFAQRGGFRGGAIGGGFRGGAIGGGFRGAAIGGGFRGAAIGGGFRGAAIGGGFRGAAIGGGFRGGVGPGFRGVGPASVRPRSGVSVALVLGSPASARASAPLAFAAPLGRQDGAGAEDLAGAEDGAGRLPSASALARRGATPTTRRTTLIPASFGTAMSG